MDQLMDRLAEISSNQTSGYAEIGDTDMEALERAVHTLGFDCR